MSDTPSLEHLGKQHCGPSTVVTPSAYRHGERRLVDFIAGELGGALLDGEITDGGEPRLVDEPSKVITDALPTRGSREATGYTFWIRDLGPLETLGNARPTTDAKELVLLRMNADLYPDRWTDLVDLSRSPVLRFHRCNWNQNGCLNPGVLQGAAAPLKAQPAELLARHRKAERWLRREGERLNPFDHCSKSPVPAPRSLNLLWVWARPHALAWVRGGGEVWPWNA